jgi:hypothetical protein
MVLVTLQLGSSYTASGAQTEYVVEVGWASRAFFLVPGH